MTLVQGDTARPSFTCPMCSRTSYHPEDVKAGYCGACHDWTGRPAGAPAPALVLGLTMWILPPPWFVAVEAPACGAELHVDAEQTNDGIERHFVCDDLAGHEEDRHRQVTDNEAGKAFTWPRT